MPDTRNDENAGRRTMISEIEDDVLPNDILTGPVPLPPVTEDESQTGPLADSGNENFSNFQSDVFNPFISHIEGIKRYETNKHGRIYLKFQHEIYQLEIVKFKIAGVNYISVNSHVLKLRDFLAVKSIEDISSLDHRNAMDTKEVLIKFDNGHEFRFHGCTVNLFVKALSDEELLVDDETVPQLQTYISALAKFLGCPRRI
jgi:hypothetical protein